VDVNSAVDANDLAAPLETEDTGAAVQDFGPPGSGFTSEELKKGQTAAARAHSVPQS
jgi:hypothetical protein